MINVLIAGNEFVFKGWLLTTLSMVKHTSDPITIYFLTMDLTNLDKRFTPVSQSQADYIEKILKAKNPESCVKLVDMTEEFNKELIFSKNARTGFTPYTMLRLLADKVDMPEKYIYLDTDTMINQDLSILYRFDIEGYELGVIRDAYRISKTYFNAGVMLVNHKECLKTGLYEKARELVIKKKMLYVDQAALNKTCTKRLMLPLIFNSKDKYNKAIVVHHFCNVRKNGNWFYRIKPWEVDLVKTKMSAYNDILDDYTARMKALSKPSHKS